VARRSVQRQAPAGARKGARAEKNLPSGGVEGDERWVHAVLHAPFEMDAWEPSLLRKLLGVDDRSDEHRDDSSDEHDGTRKRGER
jgi:hypothetical protein